MGRSRWCSLVDLLGTVPSCWKRSWTRLVFGTCYRAANWIYVGQTAGRSRMDREQKADGHVVKDVYYPVGPKYSTDVRESEC